VLLDRTGIDYTIWAQKRHKATRELFAELLRLELLAMDPSLILKVPRENATEEDLVRYLESSHFASRRAMIARRCSWVQRQKTEHPPKSITKPAVVGMGFVVL
jgi:hypothetical protein